MVIFQFRKFASICINLHQLPPSTINIGHFFYQNSFLDLFSIIFLDELFCCNRISILNFKKFQ